MKCSNCGCENPNSAVICENCGVKFNNVESNSLADAEAKNENTETKISPKKNTKTIIAIAAVLAVVVVIVVVFVSKSNAIKAAEDEINNALVSKDGAVVISVYDKYCINTSEFSDDEISAVKDVTYDFISDAIMFMNNISESDISNLDNTLTENYGTIFIGEDESNTMKYYTNIDTYISSVADEFYELYESKCSYIDGCEYMDKAISDDNVDCYSKAKDSFYKLIESDSLYDLAYNKIDECSDLINDYEKQQEVAKKLSEIDEYLKNDDIKGAEKYIPSLEQELSDEAQEYLEKAKMSKAKSYLKSAETALKEGSREAAYNYAQMALTLSPDDNEIQEKLDYYRQFLPFKLYQSENVIQYDVNSSNMHSVLCFVHFDKSYNSNNNKSMNHALSVEYYDSVVGQLCSINYNLNKKYDRINGEYFLPQSEKNTGLSTYFIVYGDGKKLFTSNNVTAGTTPENFEVKVSNVETLTVEFYGKVNDTDGIGFGSLGINDFVALKNIPKN